MTNSGPLGEQHESLRAMVKVLKHVFDEAVLSGFSQSEAMDLTSLMMKQILAQAVNSPEYSSKGD